MARNSDGTVVKKTVGALAQNPRVSSNGRGVGVTTRASVGGGLVYAGSESGYRKRGWRIVSRTER